MPHPYPTRRRIRKPMRPCPSTPKTPSVRTPDYVTPTWPNCLSREVSPPATSAWWPSRNRERARAKPSFMSGICCAGWTISRRFRPRTRRDQVSTRHRRPRDNSTAPATAAARSDFPISRRGNQTVVDRTTTKIGGVPLPPRIRGGPNSYHLSYHQTVVIGRFYPLLVRERQGNPGRSRKKPAIYRAKSTISRRRKKRYVCGQTKSRTPKDTTSDGLNPVDGQSIQHVR